MVLNDICRVTNQTDAHNDNVLIELNGKNCNRTWIVTEWRTCKKIPLTSTQFLPVMLCQNIIALQWNSIVIRQFDYNALNINIQDKKTASTLLCHSKLCQCHDFMKLHNSFFWKQNINVRMTETVIVASFYIDIIYIVSKHSSIHNGHYVSLAYCRLKNGQT